jgi:hypothetical protein
VPIYSDVIGLLNGAAQFCVMNRQFSPVARPEGSHGSASGLRQMRTGGTTGQAGAHADAQYGNTAAVQGRATAADSTADKWSCRWTSQAWLCGHRECADATATASSEHSIVHTDSPSLPDGRAHCEDTFAFVLHNKPAVDCVLSNDASCSPLPK